MKNVILKAFFLIPGLLPAASCAAATSGDVNSSGSQLARERIIDFSYKAVIPPSKNSGSKTRIFIPLASSNENQTVITRKVTAPVKGQIHRDRVYGNEFWSVSLNQTSVKPLSVTVAYKIRRKLLHRDLNHPKPVPLSKEEQKLFLGPNRRVPVSGALLDKIIADIPPHGNSPYETAKAIYNYVIDNMEYKKVGTGWGNGDTYWACSKKFGNCTDFHALFISLARAQGIPSRFEIGFPIPDDRSAGDISGYHCWVSFYIRGAGWIPVDASEAKKHPEKRELFFGIRPADRILVSIGRDIELGNGQQAPPLNYFVYPHVEINGKTAAKVSTAFSYQILKTIWR